MDDELAWMGYRHAWGQRIPFGLTAADRRHHCYVVGKTGSGKTTLLRNLILQDMYADRGVGVIDPHGDLASDLLNCIPTHRAEDLVYFDPADYDHPIGINLLEQVPPDERHLIASGIVSTLKNIWRDSWGPRMEWILNACLVALLDCSNVSILSIPRMLVDEPYRRWILRQVKDPMVKIVWDKELGTYDKRLWQDAVAPIQNKVGAFLLASPVRNILGQVKSKINARFMMDKRRIFIANLSKGRLGEDNSNLLGAILVTMFQLAAMSRTNLPEQEREDFHLVVDEFQNVSSDSFISILSEARKYRLSLTLSHQHASQLGRCQTRPTAPWQTAPVSGARAGPRSRRA
jgi:Type IV secretion-system coupling protein DNA-binding domain